jgi:hypothetical protein
VENFNVHKHIHCNQSGQKTCGTNDLALEPPNERREATINDLAPKTEQFTVKNKMPQKERKATWKSLTDSSV